MVKQAIAGVVLGSVAVLALTGCDTGAYSAPGNTTMSSAGAGALGGATVGALVDHKHPGKGALIGGAVGALGGAAVGHQMEHNNAAYRAQGQGAYNQGFVDGAAAPPPPPPAGY